MIPPVRILSRDRRPSPGQRVESSIAASYGSSPLADPSTFPIATPWSTGNMAQVFYEDVFGAEAPVNTRAAAMRIPTVARARNLIVASGARFRLIQKRIDEIISPSPSWITSAGSASHQLRLVWTIDDLIFYGWSCWARINGTDKFPLTMSRVPIGQWEIDADNKVRIYGSPVDDRDVMLIPGIHEGILNFGGPTLSDARTLYENVRARLQAPTPGLDLHQTGGRALTNPEIDEVIGRYAAARRGENAGVGFSSQYIEVKELGSGDDGKLMIESRNAMAVDLARMIGVTAGMVDATAPKASLNYETTQGRNEEFFDRDLAQYLLPIAWRASMDDVSPRGHHVAYDLSDFVAPTVAPTGPPEED